MPLVFGRRRFVTTTIGGAGAALLAACTAPAPTAAPRATAAPTPAAAPAAGQPGVELEVATRLGTDSDVMAKTVERFNRQTGHKAKSSAYPADPEYWAKVQALHATKQAADVIWASTGGIYTLAHRGVLAELDPIVQGDRYSLEDYVPAGLDSLRLNGKLYGLPWGGHAGSGAILYNVDLLDKAGLNVTDDCHSFDDVTWDQLLDAAKKAVPATCTASSRGPTW